jgi:hypothetical protein
LAPLPKVSTALVPAGPRRIEQAVAQMIEPAALARFRSHAAIHNQAVFEIPAMLEEILARSRRAAGKRAQLAPASV